MNQVLNTIYTLAAVSPITTALRTCIDWSSFHLGRLYTLERHAMDQFSPDLEHAIALSVLLSCLFGASKIYRRGQQPIMQIPKRDRIHTDTRRSITERAKKKKPVGLPIIIQARAAEKKNWSIHGVMLSLWNNNDQWPVMKLVWTAKSVPFHCPHLEGRMNNF